MASTPNNDHPCDVQAEASEQPECRAEFRLHLNEDHTAVMLDCRLNETDLDPLLNGIEQELEKMEVQNVPEHAELGKRVREALGEETEIRNEVLIQGKPPVPPVEGRIEWTRNFFDTSFAIDEKTGQIDYRRRQSNQAVTEGELLARLIPSQPGKPGYDVFGRLIPVSKPPRVKLRPGANVRVEEGEDETQSFYAGCSGRIRWEDPKLLVDKIIHIHQDVGLETGDIYHPDSVIVSGDVLSGATIDVGGDLEIEGSVESATLQVGGNLTVRGGILSDESRVIRVGGNLHTKYIENSRVEVEGDVTVDSIIINSILMTRGEINIPNGRVAGGKLTSLKGMKIGEVGCDGRITTRLFSGIDHRLHKDIAALEKDIAVYHEQMEKINYKIKPFILKIKTLTPQQREIVTELMSEVDNIKNHIEQLKQQVQEKRSVAEQQARAHIQVANHLSAETLIRLIYHERYISDSVEGPLEILIQSDQIVVIPIKKEASKR